MCRQLAVFGFPQWLEGEEADRGIFILDRFLGVGRRSGATQ
jgi:hypothetical protein